MNDALRRRPAGCIVLHSLRGHVRARPRVVFEALDARLNPGERSESGYFTDSAAFLIVAQGGRWYRGEYRVVPDTRGSNVEHTMINIAKNSRSLGWLIGRRVIRDAPEVFETLLHELRLELE